MKPTPAIRRSPFTVGLAALVVGLGACGGVKQDPSEGSTPGGGGDGSGTGGAGSNGANGGAPGSGAASGSGTGGRGGSSTGGNSGGSVGGSLGGGGMAGSGVRTDGGAGTGGRAPDAGSVPDMNAGDRAITPPSGMTLIVGGKEVPKEKLIVFIHLGHSDMMGRATGPAALDSYFHTTDPHLWMYKKGGTFTPAKESTAGNTDAPAVQTGPGMAILRTALALAPDSHMVSIGLGSSGPWCLQFRKSANTGFYKDIMDRAMELKGKATFGGIFTMLHITEYHSSTAEQMTFSDCLVGLGEEMRTDLGDPTIPLMVGGWNMGATDGVKAPDSPVGQICIPQIALVPSKTKFAGVILTHGFPMQDGSHLNREGHKRWAESGFAIMKTNGWIPWAQ